MSLDKQNITSFLAFLALFVSSCGYTLQTKADLPIDTISIGRIENRTTEPKLQDRLNRILGETFAQYGFRVDHSRYVIEGEITGFELLPVAEQSSIAAQYQISTKANFRLVDTVSGKSIPLTASSPFITYFNSSGKLESILAQKELATVSALGNLSQEMVRQITYNVTQGFILASLSDTDLKDPAGMILKLQSPGDPVSLYIREHLSYDTKKMIDEYRRPEKPSDLLKTSLLADLNSLLRKISFYDPGRFARVPLTGEVRELIRRNPQGEDRVRLNRLLLEEAYPDEIARQQAVPAKGKPGEGGK